MKVIEKIICNLGFPVLSPLCNLQEKHNGEECFIFGDGISLKWFDLNAFGGKSAFSLAYIPFHFQHNCLNLKYCFLTQPYWFYPFLKDHETGQYLKNYLQKEYRKLVRSNPNLNFFINLSNYPVFRNENIYYLYKTVPFLKSNFIRDCISKGVLAFDGSLRSAITLATYMGFKKIYLVGCDYTHEESLVGHWYEKGYGFSRKIADYQADFLQIAKKYVEIVTITKSGGSELMDYLTYEEFTGLEPIYRENDHLISRYNRNKLATWHGYKIF